MVCAEEEEWIYWVKDVEDGMARQEQKRKIIEEVHGCREGGHPEG